MTVYNNKEDEEINMTDSINEILRQFNIETKTIPYGNGHINDTYLCKERAGYIIQRINTDVFKEPVKVMDNITAVTSHLREKILADKGDPSRETLNVVKTKSGDNMYVSAAGNCYRAYEYIRDNITKETAQTPDDLYQAGKAFGKFQNRLADFPSDSLYETIPDFHNTRKRFGDFKDAVLNDICGRAKCVKEEIEFAFSRENITGTVVDLLNEGKLPLRVTHNDTKLNNVLFDSETNDAICVIDLDTVMPGSLLYDYGDALRFGASSAAEDETNLDKVYFDLDKFTAFTKGFLAELAPSITEKEKELLPFSVKLLTFECGIRFLGDYLNGDVYFKTHHPGHNLDRARTQFKLVSDIEKKTDEMKKIIDGLI